MKQYKYQTIQELTRAGGLASAKKRMAGKTTAEISEMMRKIRVEGHAKKKQMECRNAD